MTLDEAIGHANKKACGNGRCAEEYAQLADWLCELRISRIKIELLKTIRDGFKADAEYYKAENDKLRELVAQADRARRDLCNAYPDAEMLTCEECPAWGSCKGDIADSMRELGIEVGE